jgi:2,3-dihydroxyphenylpropionate 1,2-dioxygenase
VTVALLATSHSPLLEFAELDDELSAELESTFEEGRRFVKEFDPELVVNFGPDHYNGFFYNLMPAYCIGYAATSIGDYGSQAGRLDVPEEIARGLAEAVIADGIDLAVSLEMEVDHGCVQPMEIMFGDITARPFVPVFINSVAPPFTPLNRVRLLGEAVGRYLSGLGKRVLIISSGGLSHDPPVPRIATATPEQKRMLMGAGQPLSDQARAARQERVISAARDFAAGTAAIQDLAPEWDQELLRILASGDLSPIDAWDPEDMTRIAGNSSHEIRTWLAGYAALSAIGPYTVQHSYYRPIKELIAGFALTTVTLDLTVRPAATDARGPRRH